MSLILSFDANDLPQRVDDLYQVGLSRHHRVNRLVRRRSLIDHILILPALHAFSHSHVIFHCKSTLRLIPRHRATGAVTATAETLRVALAANDVRTGSHTSR